MTATPPQDEILTYAEAAALLKVTQRTLRRYVADGTVPYFRMGGLIRFSRTALVELVQTGSVPAEAG